MLTSNEPAIYREGMYGIRHENLVLCRESGSSEFGDWLDFETMTLCHIDTSAVLVDLLDRQEVAWLNAYNERVYRQISPLLDPDAAKWLREKTRPI
jgi:Xaa-Pro aminopeptidase